MNEFALLDHSLQYEENIRRHLAYPRPDTRIGLRARLAYLIFALARRLDRETIIEESLKASKEMVSPDGSVWIEPITE